MEEMSAALREGCPSFFSETDFIFYGGVRRLEKAKEAGAKGRVADRDRMGQEALATLSRVPEARELLGTIRDFEEIG